MEYRYLTSKKIEKFFDETDLSVGEILRTITQEKFSGLKIENRNIFTEKSDVEWYSIIERAYEYERED